MTQPAPAPSLDTDEQLSGRAADAVADMHDELRRRSSGLNTAEAQLAEALLAARATTEAGRARLQEIQRQLVEAINNPVNTLDTPAGEWQFLAFLRGKVAEIQKVLDEGAVTARDQSALTRALANDYLADRFQDDLPQVPLRPGRPATGSAPPPTTATASPPPAFGGLPQAAMPATPPNTGGLGSATSPLAGLASLLAGQGSGEELDGRSDEPERADSHDDAKEDDPVDDDDPPTAPDETPPDEASPTETRPAAR